MWSLGQVIYIRSLNFSVEQLGINLFSTRTLPKVDFTAALFLTLEKGVRLESSEIHGQHYQQ